MEPWVPGHCWTCADREPKQFFWSPRTVFKVKLAPDDPIINRDESNQETLEQGQKQGFETKHNHYVTCPVKHYS